MHRLRMALNPTRSAHLLIRIAVKMRAKAGLQGAHEQPITLAGHRSLLREVKAHPARFMPNDIMDGAIDTGAGLTDD